MKTKLLISRMIMLAVFGLIAGAVYTSGAIRTTLSSVFSGGTAMADEQGAAKVIFKVRCYDAGKAALQGLKGVERVETGIHYFHETDTVYYDPKKITIEDMERALKKAGTYVDTIQPE